jgi:hypothetical protein
MARYEILVEGFLDAHWSGSAAFTSAATPTPGLPQSLGLSATRQHSTDCSPRSATSACRCSRYAASDRLTPEHVEESMTQADGTATRRRNPYSVDSRSGASTLSGVAEAPEARR